MAVSLIQNLHRLSPALKKHLQKELRIILSGQNHPDRNKALVRDYLASLFHKNGSRFLIELENWEGMSLVYKALGNFGSLPAEEAEAEQLAEAFPVVFLFNGEEYLVSWEFLHFAGKHRFFQNQPNLISYLYTLKKQELLDWASWLSPTLNLYDKEKLIEFIYLYCRSFQDKNDAMDLKKMEGEIDRRHLEALFDSEEDAQRRLCMRELGLYRFLQRWSVSCPEKEFRLSRNFKYGQLICVREKSISAGTRENPVITVSREFTPR